MTTVIEVSTPIGPMHLSHPRLDDMDPALIEKLRALIQADIDAGPCLNVWHPNCSIGCAPASTHNLPAVGPAIEEPSAAGTTNQQVRTGVGGPS
jgi:hypothetical protein